MSASFFEKIDKLDSILASRTTVTETLERLRPILVDPDVERVFWARLDDPEWLPVLREEGRFSKPPAAEATSGRGVRFPSWPASKYLVRVAGSSPEGVASILRTIETDNAAVIADIVDAALLMPSPIGASLVPIIGDSARERRLWFGFEKASDLCAHLAESGEADAALELADALFAPRFDSDAEEPSGPEDHWYKEGLRQVLPLLARTRPRDFLGKLLDWLKEAIDARKDVEPESGVDYSYIWRPAVEDHPQNSRYEFAGAMVGFVRRGLEDAIRAGSFTLEEALALLETYHYLIFSRIRLHLIREFAESDRKLAIETIMNRDLLDDFRYKHEYARLVGQRYNLLPPERRAEWLSWIDSGPDLSNFEEHVQQERGRLPTDEERRVRTRWWQFEKLHWVREHIEGERENFYLEMLTEHGEPEMADLNVRVSGLRWGGGSPMTAEELGSGSFQDAVELLVSWKPDRPGEHTLEGLASTFQEYVATDPDAFSHEARLLIGRPAIIVRSFLQEMAKAAKEGREIALSCVLDLCEWVVGQPDGDGAALEIEQEGLVNPRWQWTRDEMSRFIENVCKARRGSAPRYPLNPYRTRLWGLIAELCRSAGKSYLHRDFVTEDPRVHDYFELGLNSPRGKAVGAALEYARWVALHVNDAEGGAEGVVEGFGSMPEVRDEIEWQMAPENSQRETLAMIGAHIGLFYWIDKHWLGENAHTLFNLEGIEAEPVVPQGWAAWNAFLVWTRPHVEFYRLFEAQFEYAVDQAATVALPDSSRNQPMNHLGEHLMILYARGDLSLDTTGGLLRRFLETANPEIRRYSITFIGRVAQGDEELPNDTLERLMALWDSYWAGAGQRDAQEKPNAELYGAWFISTQFPKEWRLDRLEAFSEVVPQPQPDHGVVEQLAEVALADIQKAVRILNRLVRADHEGWRIHMWLDSLRAILKIALKAGGETGAQAEELANYLGRRGYIEFGELLKL